MLLEVHKENILTDSWTWSEECNALLPVHILDAKNPLYDTERVIIQQWMKFPHLFPK